MKNTKKVLSIAIVLAIGLFTTINLSAQSTEAKITELTEQVTGLNSAMQNAYNNIIILGNAVKHLQEISGELVAKVPAEIQKIYAKISNLKDAIGHLQEINIQQANSIQNLDTRLSRTSTGI